MPVTGDTHELQFKRSPAQKWFLGLYNRTSAPILDAQKSFSNDSQGMYIVGADGTSYGYCNDHDPSDLTKVMDAALARYRAHPPKQAIFSAADSAAPFAITPQRTTAVVRTFSRIDPVPKGVSSLNESIGRDHFWIYQDDVGTLLASASRTPGGFKLPASLALRIARFHLTDNVRGTPDMWRASEVKRIDVTGHATQQGAVTRIDFSGRFAMRTASGCRGFEGTIEGEMAVTGMMGELTRFRAFAAGEAWGDGTYTPNAPKGRYHLKIAMVEAHDAASRAVPPEAVSTENSDSEYHRPR